MQGSVVYFIVESMVRRTVCNHRLRTKNKKRDHKGLFLEGCVNLIVCTPYAS